MLMIQGLEMSENLIEIRNLRVTFNGQPVVHGIDLDIRPGECLALVGESGSGKSVTAHSILQLLDPNITRLDGSIRYAGEELLGVHERYLRQLRGNRIAMIFQEPMSSLNPLHTIERQLGESLALHKGLAGAQARERMLELLELVGIQNPRERLKAYPHQLSGGQRQRVMIAMALACEPQLLIADEPTTALDVTVQRRILLLLKKLQQRLGMALLIISHDLNLVRTLAQRVAVMRGGRIAEQAPCEQLFSAPQHPYSIELLNAEPGGHALCLGATEDLLQVRDLKVRFRLSGGWLRRNTWLDAVKGIDLNLQRGKTLGIVGESGSGKSTLGQAILRLIDAEGSIHFAGEALQQLSGKQLRPLRRRLQVVFQDPFGSLSPRMTIEQIVGEGLALHQPGLSRDAMRQRVTEALREVGMDRTALGRYPHEFSGGQRQRVALARAIAHRPRILIGDEPLSALDVTVRAQILDLLRALSRDGMTLVLVSHDIGVVQNLCEDVAVMKDGRIVEHGPTARVLHHPEHDYTKRLLAAIPVIPGR